MSKGKRLEIIEPFVAPEHKEIIDKAQSQLNEYEDMLAKRLAREYPAASALGCKESMSTIIRLYSGDAIRMKMIDAVGTIKMCYEKPRFILNRRDMSKPTAAQKRLFSKIVDIGCMAVSSSKRRREP